MYIIIFYFENGSNDFDDKLTSIELSEHFEWKINYICHPSNGYKGIFSIIWYKVKEKRQVGKCALVHLSIYTFVRFSLENWKNLLWEAWNPLISRLFCYHPFRCVCRRRRTLLHQNTKSVHIGSKKSKIKRVVPGAVLFIFIACSGGLTGFRFVFSL